MMTVGEIRGLTTFLATIRDNWPPHQITYELNQLSEQGYSIVDLTAACVEVANRKQQYGPSILGIVVPEIIRERHAQKNAPKARSRRRYNRDDARLCDVCTKPEAVCQSTAANIGQLRDHDFVSVEDADRQRFTRDPMSAIAEADLFNLPEDV